jgi:hypothetical protein
VDSSEYSLNADRRTFIPGEKSSWDFEVLGPRGRPTTYRIQHERELHLIVVRDDLSTFGHLHPTRRADGKWTIDLSLPKPGSYTAFADVAPADEEPMTLSMALQAQGHDLEDQVFAPSSVSEVDGYRVELVGDVVSAASSHIEFRIRKDGEPVEPDPYLGAAGHLVAIRAGDLEYLHVHPMESHEPGSIAFMMHAAGPGLYRLFLQFLHDGEVRTAEFTLEAIEDQRAAEGSHGDA